MNFKRNLPSTPYSLHPTAYTLHPWLLVVGCAIGGWGKTTRRVGKFLPTLPLCFVSFLTVIVTNDTKFW
ncbi:hypothetical protein H6G72_29310 [Planktothricoides sp. FACHB-1370]|uniref:Uncharacterized protein n=1 Tax=Planktothricoides raciborskii FACHB-1370 TaxID=2949576 RepID=A0ABR8EQH4_9CYAN|nr:hypothetical protein [Planktothricoides raciborskii FACHB-1370]MBD2585054.1 hypothetical protein [Planktothricoides raciborskii FACHB-1261]